MSSIATQGKSPIGHVSLTATMTSVLAIPRAYGGVQLRSLAFTDMRFSYPSPHPFGRPLRPVFDAFSWQTPDGCTVILGPNGAGKTTLLSLGATALRPTRGSVGLGDLDPSRRRDLRAFRRSVGWMPQQVRPVPGLTAREQVAYAGWLKGMPRSEAWTDAARALERVGLTAEADRRTAQLSGGQQRRVGLAQLLVHRADLLLLDEPTAGLDPAQRARFRETLRQFAGEVPVVVSTHQVDDLTDLFDTVVVLDQGKIRFEGDVAAFMALAPAGGAHPAEAAYATLIADER
jgi:ABC-2 type transport system ATP-binding protein